MKILKISLLALVFLISATLFWLHKNPPELLQIGANYASKIVCSNVFLAGRDAHYVLQDDVQAPGVYILKWYRVSVDKEAGEVRAGLFGFIGNGLAIYQPGAGCITVADGDITKARAATQEFASLPKLAHHDKGLEWPLGSKATPQEQVQAILSNEELIGEEARAVVVVHQGKVIGEYYGDGFNVDTPLIGWSMTKTVNAALLGMQIGAGKLSLEQNNFWPQAGAQDERNKIRLSDLMAMSSGLEFNEDYGNVADVTRMLYLEPDMASFAHNKPLIHPIGSEFNYSSGTTVILSRILMDTLPKEERARFASSRLFAPLGMKTAIIEPDARGTLVGSSYMYASAQDWARFGQFLLQDGVWNGQRILPEGYVKMMTTPAPASKGQYGKGQVWLQGPRFTDKEQRPESAYGLPKDTFWLSGHDGQKVVVIPSKQLVIVRLGLTPSSKHYETQLLVKELVDYVDMMAN